MPLALITIVRRPACPASTKKPKAGNRPDRRMRITKARGGRCTTIKPWRGCCSRCRFPTKTSRSTKRNIVRRRRWCLNPARICSPASPVPALQPAAAAPVIPPPARAVRSATAIRWKPAPAGSWISGASCVARWKRTRPARRPVPPS